MTVREVARRLRAWEAGQPIPRYGTLHHTVASPERAFVAAFVRMAGESRPWGIAWGSPEDEPTVRSVPDGRVRDDVAQMCAEFAEELLDHLGVHNWTYAPIAQGAPPDELRQLWLPNGQHVAMLHQLAYAYSQTKYGGEDQDILNALGRVCGWLFRDSSRKGAQHLVDASRAIREAYVFPAQDARQAHLGYLLAWLTTTGDRDARLAAATQAEGHTVSPTLDPSDERDILELPVERRRTLRRQGGDASQEEQAIAKLLSSELERRWRLCVRAYDVLHHNDRRQNAGVDTLSRESMNEFWYQHQRIELNMADPSQGPAFVAHPETDFHGSSAASRYLTYAAADEAYVNALIHDDDEMFEEAMQDGHAFRGQVVQVRDEGTGRTTRPVWVVAVDTSNPNRLREGGRITPLRSKGHEASLVSLLQEEFGGLHITIEWTGRKTMALTCGIAAKPLDSAWVGEEGAFVMSDAASLTRRRSSRVWSAKDGPGAWLTHGRRPVAVEVDITDDAVETLADDIVQIEGDGV